MLKKREELMQNFNKNMANTMEAQKVLMSQVDDYKKGVQEDKERKIASEDAIIQLNMQFKELQLRMVTNEQKQETSETFGRRINIAILVCTIIAATAAIVVPILLAVLIG